MSTAGQTYDLGLLDRSMAKWRASPALRAVYEDIFAAMRGRLAPGTVLELGSGIGVAREHFPGLVTSDVARTAYVDRAISAYEIPAESWGNIIAMDMLHHLREPLRFLRSAGASLAPGGRVILAEPAGTPGGRLFYGLCHHEPCRPALIRPPYVFPADPDGGFANMGMAHALFGSGRSPAVDEALADCGLRCAEVHYRDLLAYPATGGFSRPALLPAGGLRLLLRLEQILPQALLRILALRLIVVLEKRRPA